MHEPTDELNLRSDYKLVEAVLNHTWVPLKMKMKAWFPLSNPEINV